MPTRSAHTEIAATIGFTERFVEIVRERKGEKLGEWLCDAQCDAQECGSREIWRFAHKVRQDEAAVRAGCTLPYSNGQTARARSRS